MPGVIALVDLVYEHADDVGVRAWVDRHYDRLDERCARMPAAEKDDVVWDEIMLLMARWLLQPSDIPIILRDHVDEEPMPGAEFGRFQRARLADRDLRPDRLTVVDQLFGRQARTTAVRIARANVALSEPVRLDVLMLASIAPALASDVLRLCELPISKGEMWLWDLDR